MVQGGQLRPFLFQGFREESELAVFIAYVHFQQNAGPFSRFLSHGIHEPGQAQGVHGMDQREIFQGLAHFVALEGANEMPFRIRRKGGDFSQSLLDLVFTEDALARIMARFHILCGKSFADGDEADGTRRTSGAEFRCAYAGENMFQILLDAHDGWFSSGMAVRTRGS